MGLPELHVLLRSDRDEQVLATGAVTVVDGDVEQAWLPVRCGGCGETVFLAGRQRGLPDEDTTATAHSGICEACGQAIEARVRYLHDRYRGEWQPLANPEVDGGEAIDVPDVGERVH